MVKINYLAGRVMVSTMLRNPSASVGTQVRSWGFISPESALEALLELQAGYLHAEKTDRAGSSLTKTHLLSPKDKQVQTPTLEAPPGGRDPGPAGWEHPCPAGSVPVPGLPAEMFIPRQGTCQLTPGQGHTRRPWVSCFGGRDPLCPPQAVRQAAAAG